MKPPLFSSRTFFLRSISAIVGLAVICWLFWSISTLQYRHVIDQWIEAGRASGYQISFDDRELFGFPRRITMRLTNVHWRNADNIDFRADNMDITAMPWNWNDFDAKVKGHVMLQAPLDEIGHALELSGAMASVKVRLDDEGYWKKAKVDLEDAKVGLTPNYIFAADRLNASVARPDKAPKDHTEIGLTLMGSAENISAPPAMPSPFGEKAAKLSMHLRVMGAVPDVREKASVEAWNKASGIVEFDDFSLKWGLLDLQSKGTLGFDDDLQPEGAFSGLVQDPAKTIHTLMDKGFIVMHDADMVSSMMDVFAKPAAENSKGFALPITVQLGGLFFGPVRLFTFPPIEWPLAPPPIPAK